MDDEEIIRKTADITLGTAGFSVVTANDGEECVERFHEFKDEVVAVLLDLTMPKMDGIQALKEIRKEAPGVPVILSSGFTVQEAEKRLSGQPFQAFIQKPYVRETLLRTMQDVLGAATLEHA